MKNIIRRAIVDKEFRQELVRDPAGTMKALGIELPDAKIQEVFFQDTSAMQGGYRP